MVDRTQFQKDNQMATKSKLPPSTGKGKAKKTNKPAGDKQADLPGVDAKVGDAGQSGVKFVVVHSPAADEQDQVPFNPLANPLLASSFPSLPDTVSPAVIAVPLYHEVIGSPKRRVDVTSLTFEQRNKLQRALNGLLKIDAKLRDGTDIRTEQSAIKWMLEQLPGGDA